MPSDDYLNLNHGYDVDINQVQDFPEAMFRVIVIAEDGEQTTHTVRLPEEYWQELTGGKISAEDLIEAAFNFMLKREGNESILPEFDLSEINEFFPEFEGVIRQQL